MKYSRREYWSELPFPSPGALPNPGIKPTSPMSPALQADSLPRSHQGYPYLISYTLLIQTENPSLHREETARDNSRVGFPTSTVWLQGLSPLTPAHTWGPSSAWLPPCQPAHPGRRCLQGSIVTPQRTQCTRRTPAQPVIKACSSYLPIWMPCSRSAEK